MNGNNEAGAHKRGRLAWPSNTAMVQWKTSRFLSVKLGNRGRAVVGLFMVHMISSLLLIKNGPVGIKFVVKKLMNLLF